MNNNNNNSNAKSFGFPTVLFLVFLILKLCGVINWSWIWVTAPLWIPVGMAAIVLFIITPIIYLVKKGKFD